MQGGATRSQEGPGGSQEEPRGARREPGARRSELEPGTARRSQEEGQPGELGGGFRGTKFGSILGSPGLLLLLRRPALHSSFFFAFSPNPLARKEQ